MRSPLDAFRTRALDANFFHTRRVAAARRGTGAWRIYHGRPARTDNADYETERRSRSDARIPIRSECAAAVPIGLNRRTRGAVTIFSCGAAGSVANLFSISHSAQMFLLGVEFTQVDAIYIAPVRRSPAESAPPSDPVSVALGPPSPRAG
jgi:hypothetical protein